MRKVYETSDYAANSVIDCILNKGAVTIYDNYIKSKIQ